MSRPPLQTYQPRTPHGERIVAGRTARAQTRKAAARAKASRAKVGKKTYVRRKGGKTLPGWGDLAEHTQASVPTRAPRTPSWLDQVPTLHAVLAILGMALTATLYIGHVHATTEVLAEVQQRRAEHERLSLQYNRLRADFDLATSPSAIYDRAKAIGLTEGLAYGPTIQLDD